MRSAATRFTDNRSDSGADARRAPFGPSRRLPRVADRYDLTSRAFKATSHETFARMRMDQPVYAHRTQSGRRIWYVTRHDDVHAALRSPHLVKSYRNALTPAEIEAAPPTPPFFQLLLENMLNLDPPDHRRLRTLVSKAFTPATAEQLRGRIESLADELLDDVHPRGEADLIATFAFPLPIIVICEMLGVPPEDRDRLREWSAALIHGADIDLDQERLDHISVAVSEFETYARDLFAKRRATPGPDLVTALLQAEEQEDRLSDQELVSMLLLLLVAGHETTVNLIGNGMLALLDHPKTMLDLRADPERTPAAVEEMLRYDGPAETSSRRWVAQDFELGGQALRRGDMVLVVLASANRDGQAFREPDRFDPDRFAEGNDDGERHLAFGHGIHYCLGAPLARIEGQIAIAALLRRLPDLRLAVPRDALRWRLGSLMRGLEALPVTWTRA